MGNLLIQQFKLSFASALLLYDNFLVAIWPYNDNSKRRSLINFDNKKFMNGLKEVSENYWNPAYRARMMELISREGSGFSRPVRLEVEQMFDHVRFLSNQGTDLELQIQRMKVRTYQYELEAQKPMAEVFREIEPGHQYWEISEGNLHRVNALWKPQLRVLESHLHVLKNLRSTD